MGESHALDLFPTFAETRDRLKESFCQCIWYLPDKGRHCKVEIAKKDKKESLRLASELIQVDRLSSQESLQNKLAKIAELSCCSQYHRNIFWGRGLVDMLAERWRKEIIDSLPPSITTAFVPVVAEPEEIKHPLNGGVTGLVLDQVLENNTQSQYPLRPVVFAKHAVLEGQTLMSTLLSNIDPSAPKEGSVYIFTYTDEAFEGMLKIGFTSRLVVDRLDEWAECGHGKPSPPETFSGVRHPKRVECLTHFELIKYWYAWRWCNEHKQAHIEWFKVDLSTATRVAQNWASWMERANPYDRRGGLLASWRGNIEFLKKFEIDITAELMMEIQQVEEGLIDVTSFIDDDELRRLHKPMVKQNIPIRSRARRRCVSSTPLNSSGNQLER